MKKFTLIILTISLLFSGYINAQNNEGKADDGDRIAITPQVSGQDIPQGAKNMLINKMKQICTKNGLSGDTENPFFVMDATIDVLSKEITPTAPPMHALNLQINFFIKDANGAIFSETSYTAKGVGQNETKAYMGALKNINTSSGQFKAMVDRGKEKILEFYNSQCDFIVSKANALHKQGNDKDAIKVLKSVPPVSKECYDQCMEILATIEHVEEPVAPVINAAAPTPAATANPSTSGSPNANASAATTATVASAATVLAVNSKVYLNSSNEIRNEYKKYTPGKIKTMASASTKNEYEVMAMGDCSTDVRWSGDIITQWHKGTLENVKEGMLVLYTDNDNEITDTRCFWIGKVIAVDELYKNLVTIKGWGNNIYKVNFEQVLIVDNSTIKE